ncbi:hypothetical protein FRC12_014354 [Ceratobasidium sp. 428]|nr:hypothetical protein FRC12_014354 [Ceratobasidium sp. 428]
MFAEDGRLGPSMKPNPFVAEICVFAAWEKSKLAEELWDRRIAETQVRSGAGVQSGKRSIRGAAWRETQAFYGESRRGRMSFETGYSHNVS